MSRTVYKKNTGHSGRGTLHAVLTQRPDAFGAAVSEIHSAAYPAIKENGT